MLLFVEGGKPENPEKTLGARTRTDNKLNPHTAVSTKVVSQKRKSEGIDTFVCVVSLYVADTPKTSTKDHEPPVPIMPLGIVAYGFVIQLYDTGPELNSDHIGMGGERSSLLPNRRAQFFR